jgi:cobyrinic acid a,c-diamide synthase
LPIYAECGGLLLLGERLEDPAGVAHPMAGVLPFMARRGELQLGYRQASPRLDGLVVRRGEILTGHEFHRWELAPPGGQADGAAVDGAAVDGAAVDGGAVDGGGALWQLEGWGWPPRPEGWTRPALHASWLHLHWAGCSAICRRLVAAAARSRPWRTAMPPAASAPAASGSAGGWW